MTKSTKSSGPFRAAAAKRYRRQSLSFCALEDRRMLATFVVNSTADINDGDLGNGLTTLREAVDAANAAPNAADRIVFNSAVFSTDTTIALDRLLWIRSDLSIEGPQDVELTLDGGNGDDGVFGTGDGDRIFLIQGDGTGPHNVSLSDLTLTGGDRVGSGGAIANTSQTLSLTNVDLLRNHATIQGGGISILGNAHVSVTGGSIERNSAGSSGGGILDSGLSLELDGVGVFLNSAARGGGVFVDNNANATIIDSSISDNDSSIDGGGIFNEGYVNLENVDVVINSTTGDGAGIFNADGGALSASNSLIANGFTISGSGGGIFNAANASLELEFTRVESNSANFDGGGIFNQNLGDVQLTSTSVLFNNSRGSGGGIGNFGTLAANDSRVDNNSSRFAGGGINNFGSVTLEGTDVNGNFGSVGGGISNGFATATLALSRSEVSDNEVDRFLGDGGGIYNVGTADLNRVLIRNNAAAGGNGGGVFNSGTTSVVDSSIDDNASGVTGGGIYNSGDSADLSVTNTSFTRNSAIAGGGLFNDDRTLVIEDSEFIDNEAGDGGGLVNVFNSASEFPTEEELAQDTTKLTIRGTTFRGNTANGSVSIESLGRGGALGSFGLTDIQSSTFDANVATEEDGSGGGEGGGFAVAGVVTINRSTFSNNIARGGGAGAALNSNLTISNSTISGNDGGQETGGLFASRSQLHISHTTFADNVNSVDRRNIAFSNSFADVHVDNSIISGTYSVRNREITGNYNWLEVFDGQQDINGVGNFGSRSNIALLPLADNGGPVQTHELTADSLAIDAGQPSTDGLPEFDQRGMGFDRVQFGRVDVGALEYNGALGNSRLFDIVVDSVGDEYDGDFSDGELTLREAIVISNTSTNPDFFGGPQTITFSELFNSQQIISLSSQLPTISNDLEIIGPGQSFLTIDAGDGDDNVEATSDGFRIFRVERTGFGAASEVSISGVTLTGGDVSLLQDVDDSGTGGAILNSENLTLTDVSVVMNAAAIGGGIDNQGGSLNLRRASLLSNQSEFSGGGIFNDEDSSLTVMESQFSNNLSGRSGGAISNSGEALVQASSFLDNQASKTNDDHGGGAIGNEGDLIVDNSLFMGNSAFGGGAILNDEKASIENSTFFGNRAEYIGGAISSNGGNVDVSSSTVSGNSIVQDGGGAGGIYVFNSGRLEISQSTIVNNSTAGDEDLGDAAGRGRGGGIVVDLNATALISNTVVANNTSGAIPSDIVNVPSASVSGGSNLIGDSLSAGGFANGTSGNIVGSAPMLSPLENFGGPTLVHMPLAGSPLIDAGASVGNEFDQRGENYSRSLLAAVDIGAVEYSGVSTQIPSTGLLVSTTDDVIDGNYSTGNLSLREAIFLANVNGGEQEIEFALPGNGPHTIELGSSLPTITEALSIIGPGAELLAVDGGSGLDGVVGTGDGFRVFKVASDLPVEVQEVAISGLTITGGDIGVTDASNDVNGGGILNEEGLTLFNVLVEGNATSASGGGVANQFGNLTLDDTVIRNNSANGGGGIQNGNFLQQDDSGVVIISDSLIEGNEAANNGGAGILNRGSLFVGSSLIHDNHTTAFALGGGLANRAGGQVEIHESTISGNSTEFGGGGIFNAGRVFVSSSTINNNSSGDSGGGLLSFDGLVSLTNSTFSTNVTETFGGGLSNNLNSGLLVVNSTFSNNAAGVDGGGVVSLTPDRALFVNSIVANNMVGALQSDIAGNVGGFYNLIGDSASAGGFVNGLDDNIVGVDARLGPLAFNGGPTMSHALLAASPAIDAAAPAEFLDGSVLELPLVDQRGAIRISGQADVGATERFEIPLVADITDVSPDPRNSDAGVVTISFNEDVFGFDIEDLTLALDGNAVDIGFLTLVQVSPSQYTIDLSAVTAAEGTYELRVDSQLSRILGVSGDVLGSDAVDEFTVDTTAPRVESFVINDGEVQRSVVTEIKVTFSEIVANVEASSFVLKNTTNNTCVTPVVSTEVIDGKTVATLTFEGVGITGGSLADGDYTLTVLDNLSDDAGNQLDGNGDGLSGGNATDDFFRLFGDANGDRTVNVIDLLPFRRAFGSSGVYDGAFDFNGDGSVNVLDLLQFRIRFGTTL